MGRDQDQFVHPERISSQLICPICTQVLLKPVQTSTEHLFCEDELLEWMTRSNLCPITKNVLDPKSIRKPGRIIMNMLAELEIYCGNRKEGCNWQGTQDLLETHLEQCQYRPRNLLLEELNKKQQEIEGLQRLLDEWEIKYDELNEENINLKQQVLEYQQRLRVFLALVPGQGGKESQGINDADYSPDDEANSQNIWSISDAERLRNIRSLKTLTSTSLNAPNAASRK